MPTQRLETEDSSLSRTTEGTLAPESRLGVCKRGRDEPTGRTRGDESRNLTNGSTATFMVRARLLLELLSHQNCFDGVLIFFLLDVLRHPVEAGSISLAVHNGAHEHFDGSHVVRHRHGTLASRLMQSKRIAKLRLRKGTLQQEKRWSESSQSKPPKSLTSRSILLPKMHKGVCARSGSLKRPSSS